MLCRQDLPAHWKIPHDMDARTQAGLQLGLAAEQVEIVPCLVAPECSWFIAYLEWLHGQPKPNDSVSVFMWDTAAFFSVFGPKATERFIRSMHLLGRPHHLHAAIISTVEGHQQVQPFMQLSQQWYQPFS